MKSMHFLPALLLLAACSGQETETPAAPASEGTPSASETPEPYSPPAAPVDEAEIKAFTESFEAAMQEVPPELRGDFQKYFTCEIEKNSALPVEEQVQFDAASVREMTAKLKADPSLAQC